MRGLRGALATLALLLSACREPAAPGGHATVRFAGSVTGFFDSDLEVECWAPAQPGDPYTVSLDSRQGVRVGGTRFLALDLSVPQYAGPRSYELRQLADDPGAGDDYFLLFARDPTQPFGWVNGASRATITIDPGEQSGRAALRGLRSGQGDQTDVYITFRCGQRERGRPRPGELGPP